MRVPWLTVLLAAAMLGAQGFVSLDGDLDALQRRLDQTWLEAPYLVPTPHLSVTSTRTTSDLERARSAVPPDVLDRQQRDLFALDLEVERGRLRAPAYRFGLFPDEPLGPSVFLHPFVHTGWWHLFTNLLFLTIAAAAIEARSRRVWGIVFVVGCVATSLAHTLYAPAPIRNDPLVGSSGIALAFVFAVTTWAPRARLVAGRAWWLAVLVTALALLTWSFGATVGHAAHLGGAVGGGLVGLGLHLQQRRHQHV